MSARGLLRRLFRHRGGQVGTLILAVLAFFAVFAEWIACDAPLYLRYQGTSYVLPALLHRDQFGTEKAEQIAASLGPDDRAVWPIFRVGPSTVTDAPPMAGTSPGHLLGTDAFGRDVFARLVHGTRASLVLGAAVALMAVLGGFVLGCVGGALGGVFQNFVERFVELTGVFPAVVAIGLVRALERKPSLFSLVIVIAAIQMAGVARLVRALVLRSMAEEWATAARAMGASPLGVAFRHITPHLAAPLAVSAVFAMGSVVLTETSLSFLDLGLPAHVASWGEMLGEIRWGAGARILLPPILALALTLAALHLIADAIRSVFES